MQTTTDTHEESINRAFSKQSAHYDAHDEANPILRDMRKQVYSHVEYFLKPNSHILELNAGTGIDAVHFLSLGHRVHAIDISEGMIEEIRKKQHRYGVSDALTFERLSYQRLDLLAGRKFDHVFSNFGGLNCISDLSVVATQLPQLLKPGARITLVTMPPVCPWELITVLKGRRNAFRRFRKGGVTAHVEGEYFDTYYHSLQNIMEAFGSDFRLLKSQGLAVFTPPPNHAAFPEKHPLIYKGLRKVDEMLRNWNPFNRWGDHIIVTLELDTRHAS